MTSSSFLLPAYRLPFHLTQSNISWNDRLRNAHPLHAEAVFRFFD